ncbi:GNAT family N-acetyltransferase [Rhizobium ruizarguesonis]|jgi:aminoglycoside 6'-N-acetyltransferase I|uniref:GNAT family N-acetyltransferase n=1 Tax=Rhizobium ruizarguesonis TaxID=2081791 RepID=A0AAE8Q8P6_9HYPH|nr:GNAT family N-acetyltransferase [Rhizobium ruizarguesonis]MBY5887211.1 GNAT family N-acetyltransferase [Rhizobium leguminosarum]NKL13095.1 GNAT family N-acetyltransferase [Rhizobium leguminosarum bv. viciae]MBC2808098.1 GNAT family N-acetyltransferase [Rhizobium ruizarguesonis]MBY5897074.1 GNAT family N-acetyltransferase [Rhizobium leguminosarum]MCB2403987.1 GNAT family N-acetyltransferase [Rhizobium ruizarguesonis]
MPEVITTCRLTRDTVGLLENIAEEVFDQELNAQRLATYLKSSGHLMIIAVCEKQVIGQIAAYVHSHPDRASDVYIDNLGVAPPFQRRGVARRLLDEVLAWGKTLDCDQAWIVTDTGNNAARALYEGRGAAAEPIVMFSYKL